MTLDIRPAPKLLAQLAEAARGWPYEDIRQALIACHDAGWDDERIYRETFRLLLLRDSGPADLRAAARVPHSGGGMPTREDTVALVAAYRARVAGQAAADGGDPEGGEAA